MRELLNQAFAYVMANYNFATLKHTACYGVDGYATTGLTWAYYGGRWGGFSVADGTFTLSNNATNYIVVAIASGVTTCSTSATNWDDTANYRRVYKVVTLSGAVSGDPEDHREGPGGVAGSVAGGGGVGDMVLATVQTVTGAKTFGSAGAVGKLKVAGTTSGAVTLDAPAVAGSGTVTLPASGALATQAYVDNAVTGLWDVKGGTDCSANPNYPSALKGDAYVVTVAGKIGGASGTSVDVGDVYVAVLDNAGGTEASVGTSWIHIEHNLAGVYVAGGTDVAVADGGTGASTAAGARTNLAAAFDASTVTALSTSGTVNIDLSLGDFFTLALAGNVTSITFSNLPGSGKGASKWIQFTQDSTPRTVAWPASFKWAGGVAGAVSTGSGAIDELAITTVDNGTTWKATLGKAFA